MASLTVRNLEDDLVRLLRIRAAENGRSAEAEHREILRTALKGTPKTTRAEGARLLAELQEELRGRKFDSAADLRESRRARMRQLSGSDEGV